MLTFASWPVKHICFVRFHFFRFFFHPNFLSKSMHIAAYTCFRRLSCESGARLCAKPIIYYGSGTIFSRRPTLGRLLFESGANSTFSIFVFIFCEKWVWHPYHTLGLWGPLREALVCAKACIYLGDLMFFLRTPIFTMRIWYFLALWRIALAMGLLCRILGPLMVLFPLLGDLFSLEGGVWDPFWTHQGPLWSSFKAFWHLFGSFF